MEKHLITILKDVKQFSFLKAQKFQSSVIKRPKKFAVQLLVTQLLR